MTTFSTAPGKFADLSAIKSKSGVSEQDWTYALEYAAQVASILVNYKSFGFSKFVPRVGREEFAKIVKASPRAEEAVKQWDKAS